MSMDTVSSGAGGGLRPRNCPHTRRTGPARPTRVSSACRPAPVMPPPGDSEGRVRQPPVTLFEFSLLLCPSTCRIWPSAPDSITRPSSRIAGHQRRLCPAPSTTPARTHASIMIRASAMVSASGFSQKTCLPASAHATTCSRCSECGVTRTSACTAGSASASARSDEGLKPCRAARSRATSGAVSTPRTKRIRLLLPCTDSRKPFPHRPRPTMAASIMRSFRLDARFLRFPRPFGDFALDVVRELLRVHGRNVESHDPEASLDVGLGDALVDGAVEPVDDLARRAGGRHQAVPQDRLEARQLLGDRRNIGRERGARERGYAEAFHLAALDLREPDREVREGE